MEIAIIAILYAGVIIFNFKPVLKNNSKKEIWIYLTFIAVSLGICILKILNPHMLSISHFITGIVNNFANVK